MSYWEANGRSDEWFTPKYVFDALGCTFDTDVAAPVRGAPNVPSLSWRAKGSNEPWQGFVWMNPPFGGRNGIAPWLDLFFAHGNGIALTPDRTSASWWQSAARKADAILFVSGKIKFHRSDGATGKQPSNGTTLFSAGAIGTTALMHASRNGLGYLTAALSDLPQDGDIFS